MKRNRKAKILATLGPASSSEEIIDKLFVAGCDVFRLNFSHGSIEDHRNNYKYIRSLEKKYDHATCILADLQGPKLRIGTFVQDKIELKKGQSFILDLDSSPGNKDRVNFPHEEIYETMTPNSEILIDDGRIKLQIIKQEKKSLTTEVLNSGIISNNKGVNIPGVVLPISSLTQKDKSDLNKALEMGVDWVALSFIQSAEDINNLKKLVGNKASIMAKIEKPSAVKNIDSIIEASDGLMIARGDLAIDIGHSEVPKVQLSLIKKCSKLSKSVIVATQMLESMINNPTPTRAEASDVANAIYDGSDAVMLSGETSIGNYPDEAVKSMSRICEEPEKQRSVRDSDHRTNLSFDNIPMAIAMSSMYSANHIGAKAICSLTETGGTCLWMSRISSGIPIFAFTRHTSTRRRVALFRGVFPMKFDITHTDPLEANKQMIDQLTEQKIVEKGDFVIITKGDLRGERGASNNMKIIQVGQALEHTL